MRSDPHQLERALVGRGFRNWLLLRVMAVALLLIWGVASSAGAAILGSAGNALLIPIIAVTVSLLDAKRRGELVFIANMGVSLPRHAILLAIPAAVGELALSALVPSLMAHA